MTEAKCTRCGATVTGDSLEDARAKMNHAIGLSRGIKCGDNYNCVEEIKKESSTEKPKIQTPPKTVSNIVPPKTTKSKVFKEE